MPDITLESIQGVMNAFHAMPPVMADPFAFNFAGMKIIEARERPVLQISPDFEWCSEKVRDEMNLWLLVTFGMRSIVPDGIAYVFGSNCIMNPRSIVAIHNFTA